MMNKIEIIKYVKVKKIEAEERGREGNRKRMNGNEYL